MPPANDFRVVEANLSAHLAGHEISFGKSDEWMGVASGGGKPLHIPGLSTTFGPFRHDFLVGSLKGHT